MPDQLSAHYRDLLAGSYDCVARVVRNAHFRFGMSPGGFRYWRQPLTGSEEQLDNEHWIRMAVRFSRRVRAYAKAHQIPLKDGAPGEKKHKIGEQHLMGEQHLAGGEVQPGLFFILVAKAPALVWEVKKRERGPTRHYPSQRPPAPWKGAMAIRQSLLLSYLGPGVGTYPHQDEGAPTVGHSSDV
jgi:hypothetical protein